MDSSVEAYTCGGLTAQCIPWTNPPVNIVQPLMVILKIGCSDSDDKELNQSFFITLHSYWLTQAYQPQAAEQQMVGLD